jgi:zinc transporter 1
MSPLAHRRSSSSARGRLTRSQSRRNSIHIAPGDMDDITEVNSGAATPYARGRSMSSHEHTNGHGHDHDHDHDHDHSHAPFKHAHPVDLETGKSKRRHSHGSMNMRALVLHVMGDALGNVGVIGSGLVIWLTTWQYRYYSDPIISLIITCIIFSSALPLVKSASFILLQGVPESVNLEDVREDISTVDGVISIHELHVWQLSESKHVASVHILLRKKDDFMRVVRDIRRVLHEHDIHSGTIQPEFADFGEDESEHASPPINCLVTCPPGLCQDQTCCRKSINIPDVLPLSDPFSEYSAIISAWGFVPNLKTPTNQLPAQ